MWNTQVFDFIVAENETTGPVQAVVTSQFRTAENTGLIRSQETAYPYYCKERAVELLAYAVMGGNGFTHRGLWV